MPGSSVITVFACFCFDLCSLGHVTLTGPKGGRLCLDGLPFTLISMLASKRRNWNNAQGGAITHNGKNTLKNQNSHMNILISSDSSRMHV